MEMDDYKSEPSRGFTLIELLTVIFIIGLLAAILIPSVSKVREKAKISAAEADLRSLATALTDYQVDNGTLPPIAGCSLRVYTSPDPTSPDYDPRYWYPYVARLPLIGTDVRTKFYDRFSESEDLNRDGKPYVGSLGNLQEQMAEDRPEQGMVNLLEWQQRGRWVPDSIAGVEKFREPNGSIDEEKVPYQYFPVNSRNIAKFRQLLSSMEDGEANRAYTVEELRNAGLTIPAQRYDRFVLFSLGPQRSDQGIVPRNADNRDDLRLRAYYRATRDLNNNQLFDFNFRDRARKLETYPLPDGSMRYGVIILAGP